MLASAYEYELDGKIKGQQFFKDGMKQELGSYRIHLFVRNCEWKMRVVPEAIDEFSKRIAFWEYSFDGKEARSIARLRNESGELDGWLGSAANDQVPVGTLVPHIPVFWFAVASACYLNCSSDKIVPVYLREFQRPEVDALILRRDHVPHLPERVFFISSDSALTLSPSGNGDLSAKGVTNAVFAATEFRKYESVELPTRFTLEVFSGQGDTRFRKCLFQGEVDSVVARCSIRQFSPDLPEDYRGQIKDYRFISDGALSIHPFVYESSGWIERAEASLKPGFSNYLRNEQMVSRLPTIVASDSEPKALKNRFPSVVILLLVACVSPLLLWLISRKQRNKHKQRTTNLLCN